MNYPSRRGFRHEAEQLRAEANTALRPIGDELASLSSSFDGITLFWPDKRQAGNLHHATVADVATAQPTYDERSDRFEFYRESISGHHVRLGGTALEQTLRKQEAVWRKSLMNHDHMTFGTPVLVDGDPRSIVQSVFNRKYGVLPAERTLQAFWRKHQDSFQEITNQFKKLDDQTESIGDTLELELPTTPNAYIISWDLIGSTQMAKASYPAMSNLLVDIKDTFSQILETIHDYDHDDTGDGTNIIAWLPEYSSPAVAAYGKETVLPLVDKLCHAFQDVASLYPELSPQIRFAVDIGSVVQDFTRYDQFTSPNFWLTGKLLKDLRDPSAVVYSENTLRYLEQNKTPN